MPFTWQKAKGSCLHFRAERKASTPPKIPHMQVYVIMICNFGAQGLITKTFLVILVSLERNSPGNAPMPEPYCVHKPLNSRFRDMLMYCSDS